MARRIPGRASYTEASARNAGPGYGAIEAMALHAWCGRSGRVASSRSDRACPPAVILEADRLNRADADIGATPNRNHHPNM